MVFGKRDGLLVEHPITKGIDEVVTFTDLFGPASWAENIAASPNTAISLPNGSTASCNRPSTGTGLRSSRCENEYVPMGLNAPVAKQNPQFLLNLVHWLAGV
jgi:hypothetical protein